MNNWWMKNIGGSSIFYGRIVYLQCCVSFRCTAKSFRYIYIYILFQILLPYRLLPGIEYSSLCCPVGPLFVCFMHRAVYMMVLKYKWKNTPHVMIEMYTETTLRYYFSSDWQRSRSLITHWISQEIGK